MVVARGGPKLIPGMGALRNTLEAFDLPYRMFGFDSALGDVVAYAQAADAWMARTGRAAWAARHGGAPAQAA